MNLWSVTVKIYTIKKFNFIQRLVINTLMLLALAGLFPQGLYIASVWTAIWAALVLGILNSFFRPVLQFFALPFTLLTFGLFAFVVNAFVLWVTASIVGAGFHFASFGWALLMSIMMSLVNAVVSSYFSKQTR